MQNNFYPYPFKLQNSSQVFTTEMLLSDINRTEQIVSSINKFSSFRLKIELQFILTEKVYFYFYVHVFKKIQFLLLPNI